MPERANPSSRARDLIWSSRGATMASLNSRRAKKPTGVGPWAFSPLDSVDPHLRPEVALLVADEVRRARRVDQVRAEVHPLHVVLRDTHHLVEDVARLAHAKRPVARPVPLLNQVVHAARVELHPLALAHQLPDPAVLRLVGVA